jgi:hypothetical protein
LNNNVKGPKEECKKILTTTKRTWTTTQVEINNNARGPTQEEPNKPIELN